MTDTIRNIHIISDGTGETALTMIKAALVLYAGQDINLFRHKSVRTEQQVAAIIDEAFEHKGFIAHTVISPELRNKIQNLAAEKGMIAVDFLGPLLTQLDSFFGVNKHSMEPGLLRTVNEHYFKRIAAIEYTVKHDDGKDLTHLDEADIILVGVSRTSKTPLSIFLSHKGWKVANIPIVLNHPLPEIVEKIDQRKIVALSINPDKLSRIRKNRMERLLQDPGGDYADMSHIHAEIEYAHSIYKTHRRWPVFDVSEKALEETATEIIRLIASRMGLKEDNIY